MSNPNKTLQDLRICSHNIRGLKLNTPEDFSAFSRLYLEPNYDIVILIETQTHPQTVANILKHRFRLSLLPKYTIHPNSAGEHSKRGIVILVKNSSKITIKGFCDFDPNLTKISLRNDHQDVGIFAVYAPSQENNSKSIYLDFVYNIFQQSQEDVILFLGDWNVTLSNIDRLNYHPSSHQRSSRVIRNWLNNGSLIDVYRQLYPDEQSFTYKKNDLRGRLDYVLANLAGASCINSVLHRPVPDNRSDHCILVVNLLIKSSYKGPGIFRAQPLLQNNPIYKFKIKEEILNIYTSISSSDPQTILLQRFWGHRLNHLISKQSPLTGSEIQTKRDLLELYNPGSLLQETPTMSYANTLEFVLMKLKLATKSFQSRYNKIEKNVITSIQDKIEELSRNPSSNLELLSKYRLQLDVVLHNSLLKDAAKLNGFRYLKDERLSREVMNIEKRIASSYVDIPSIRDPTSKEITKDPKEINIIMSSFMREIYKKPPYICSTKEKIIDFLTCDDDDHLIDVYKSRSLSHAQREAFETNISCEELRSQLFNHMNASSAPGIDGFTVSWLREFWDELGPLVTKSLDECLETGTLPYTLHTAVMKLLRKGNKDHLDPNNYRPISLLSVFYKVASGAITRRIHKVYEQLVGSHQVAYSTKRNISSVPINILNAIQSTLDNKEQALVVALDFRKAFDSLSHSFITQILELLNFGPKMIKYVSLFFEGRNTQLLISGILGEKIPLDQSVPQGDILSPTIFNIAVDPLLLKIIYTKNLKGISIGGKSSTIPKLKTNPTFEYRANSFADDATAIIQAQETYLRYLVKTIEKFTMISGLHANLSKTTVVPVGFQNWDVSQILAPDLNLQWREEFCLLGFLIDNKLSRLPENYLSRLEIIKTIISKWKRHHLSISGRINVAKGLLVSQLSHQAVVLDLSPQVIDLAENSIIEYIINDNKKWISQDMICTPKNRYGLGFFYLDHFYSAIQVNFLKNYNPNCKEPWALLLDQSTGFSPKQRHNLWKMGDIKLEILAQTCNIHGIKNCLKALSKLMKIYPTNNQKDNTWFCQPLFLNSNVRSYFPKPNSRGRPKKSLTPLNEDHFNLPGNCVLLLSDLFHGGAFKSLSDLSHSIRSNIYPPPAEGWTLAENSYLRLKNATKYICEVANRDTYNGIKLCFPDFPPFIFPNPPKYSYKNVHELIGQNRKGSAPIRKIFSRDVNINWEQKAEKLRAQTGDESFSIMDVKRIFSVIGKSSLDPLTKEKILRLIQRKYIFNANWEHCPNKPDPYYGPGCTLCRLQGNPNPPKETMAHAIKTCPVVKSLLDAIPSFLNDPPPQQTQNLMNDIHLISRDHIQQDARPQYATTDHIHLDTSPSFPFRDLDHANPVCTSPYFSVTSELLFLALMEILHMRIKEELPTPNIIIKKIHFHVSTMTKTNEKQKNKYLPFLLRIEARMGHFVNPPDPVQR